jgi:hypothetical protein
LPAVAAATRTTAVGDLEDLDRSQQPPELPSSLLEPIVPVAKSPKRKRRSEPASSNTVELPHGGPQNAIKQSSAELSAFTHPSRQDETPESASGADQGELAIHNISTLATSAPSSEARMTELEHIVLFFGKAFVFAKGQFASSLITVRLEATSSPAVELIEVRQTVVRGVKRGEPEVRSVLCFDLGASDALNPGAEVSIAITDERGVSSKTSLSCRNLSYPLRRDDILVQLMLQLAGTDLVPQEASELLSRPVRKGAIRHNIDATARTVDGLAIDGWFENAAARNYLLVSSDLVTYLPKSEILFKSRSDVSKHLSEAGVGVLTHHHGFMAHVPLGRSASSVLGFRIEPEGTLLLVCTITTASASPVDNILELFWTTTSNGRAPPPEIVRKFISPLLKMPEQPISYNIFEVVKGSAQARVSVIVPFYREWTFIRSITLMQLWFPADFEWIFVCDDPSIEARLESFLRARSNLLRNRTLLVRNRGNFGFAIANNIGAEVAKGELLLLMNSDIWIENSQPVDLAISALRSKQYSAIGFRLRFEDGSLQHDGMQFVRSPELHNLFLAQHVGKGLPFSASDEKQVIDVTAVTAALMMLPRSTFMSMGGFGQQFIRGDFEDADLCLRLKKTGRRIGLVQNDVCFHLERQSIRHMAPAVQRQAVTLTNCVTFNDLWGADLSAISESLPNVAER